MKFPCLVKIKGANVHCILLDIRTCLVLEGSEKYRIVQHCDPRIIPVFIKPDAVVFEYPETPQISVKTPAFKDYNIYTSAWHNACIEFGILPDLKVKKTIFIEKCLTDLISDYYQSQVSPEPQLEWHTEHEVKNTFNQFVPVDVVFEDEKRIWFRYRPAESMPMQQPAMSATPLHDVHSETLNSIAKSSKHYRVTKKADVTMSECLTQIVTDGPVKATIIITE